MEKFRKKKRSGKLISDFGLEVTLAVIGSAILLLGVYQFKNDDAVSRWEKVEGVVTSAELVEDIIIEGEANNRDITTVAFPDVRYVYKFDGKEYTGHRINLSKNTGSANFVLSRYQVGNIVTVYVDPWRPSQSVLEVSASRGPFLIMIIGLVLASPAFYSLLRNRTPKPF